MSTRGLLKTRKRWVLGLGLHEGPVEQGQKSPADGHRQGRPPPAQSWAGCRREGGGLLYFGRVSGSKRKVRPKARVTTATTSAAVGAAGNRRAGRVDALVRSWQVLSECGEQFTTVLRTLLSQLTLGARWSARRARGKWPRRVPPTLSSPLAEPRVTGLRPRERSGGKRRPGGGVRMLTVSLQSAARTPGGR